MKSLSHVRLLATPWTAAHQAPPSMGFSRQEHWSGCHRLLPGNDSSMSMGRRGTGSWWIGCRAHGSGEKPVGSGEVAAVTSFRSTVLLSRDQTCPSSSRPVSGVFSQLLSRMRKDRACQNQGGAHIMTAVETVNITEPKGKGRTSLGQCGERRPTLPFFLLSQEVTGTHLFPP